MKIGYILTTFPSQSETFAAGEIKALCKSGFDITVFAATDNWHPNKYTQGINIVYRASFFSIDAITSIAYMILNYPQAMFKLFFLILRFIKLCPREAILLMCNLHTISFFARHINRTNISHIHAYFLSWPACIGLALAKVTNRPFSIAAHARDIFVEHGAVNLKVANAGFVVTCTKQGLRHLKTNVSPKHHQRLYLNYHGVNANFEVPELFDKQLSELKPNNTVIAVGRLIPKKGFDNLIKAFALITKEIPASVLIIVGQGPEKKTLDELVAELMLKGRIHLLGWQDHDITLRLIRQATVLVAPSLIADDGDRDGIPNVILEAFAAKTAVIASNLEGISEAVKDEKTGLIVEPGDFSGFAHALKRLLTNKNLQHSLCQNAHKVAMESFDCSKNINQLANLFKESERCQINR